MKQYKLLRDLPFVKTGKISNPDGNGVDFSYGDNCWYFTNKEVIRAIEEGWIEEVNENETTINKLEKDECYVMWYECDKCKNNMITEDSNFCPNCGLKIKK